TGNMRAGPEMAIGLRAAVRHETVEVRMGGVALELPQPHATWPGCLADIRACERTGRMLREGEPETRRLGPRSHVVHVDVVRVGDPESRRRVVGRDQDILGALAGQIEVLAALRSERTQVGRFTGFTVRMTLGHH